MKTVRLLVLALFALTLRAAEEKKPELPPLPETVTLTSGTILRKVSVVRFETAAVVLKYSGGVAPIQYRHIVPEQRAIFESYKAKATAEQQTAAAAANLAFNEKQVTDRAAQEALEKARKERAERIAQAIRDSSLVVGMTTAEALQSWGQPDKINSSGGAYGSHEQWIYKQRGTYVYFDDGLLSSWQQNNVIR